MENVKNSRVTREEALDLFQEDIYTLGKRADMVKKELLGSRADYACFIIDRNINTTNICSAKCNFCAFYREQIGLSRSPRLVLYSEFTSIKIE